MGSLCTGGQGKIQTRAGTTKKRGGKEKKGRIDLTITIGKKKKGKEEERQENGGGNRKRRESCKQRALMTLFTSRGARYE